MSNCGDIQIQSISVEGAALIVLIRKSQPLFEPIFDLVHYPFSLLALPNAPHNPDETTLVLLLDHTDMFHHGFDLKMVV